jgi:hypothetical protein
MSHSGQNERARSKTGQKLAKIENENGKCFFSFFCSNGVAKFSKNGLKKSKFGNPKCVTCHTDGAAMILNFWPNMMKYGQNDYLNQK